MKNILFIAAHPDDELVGATFIIKKILQKKNIIIFFFQQMVLFQKKKCGFGIKKNIKKKNKKMKR